MTAFVVSWGIFLGGPTAQGRTRTSERCGVDQQQPAQRTFAHSDGKHGWREFANSKEVPELELDSGEAALLWMGHDGNTLVRMEEPGEDFAAYTDYCFDKAGTLVQLGFELRTAWGWGYRLEGRIVKGRVTNRISEFFNSKSDGRIPKPEQADDIADALKPRLYLKESQLPFFKILHR